MLNSAVFQKSLYYLYKDKHVQLYAALDRTCVDLALEERTYLS